MLFSSSTRRAAGLRQTWDRTLVLGRHSYELVYALWVLSSTGSGTAKDVLVQQAQSHQNVVAKSLLSCERELNRIQYYGLVPYLQKELGRSSLLPAHVQQRINGEQPQEEATYASSSSHTTSITSIASGNNDKRIAKVAFMITAAQRQELTERLQYEAAHVKRMTPLEASLILQHSVIPEDKDTKLPDLVKQHEVALEEQQKKAKEKAQKEELRHAYASLATGDQQSEAPPPSTLLPSNDEAERGDSSFEASETVNNISEFASTSSSASKKLWFEVVEERDGIAYPMALYDTEQEASSVLKLKQEFAERDVQDHRTIMTEPSTYKIRRTYR